MQTFSVPSLFLHSSQTAFITTAASFVGNSAKGNDLLLPYCLTIATSIAVIVLAIMVINLRMQIRHKDQVILDNNTRLLAIRQKLKDTGNIKENYIGLFFNIISDYITKLEKLKRSAERKIMTRKYDDIQLLFNDINIRQERENLFNMFDDAFLKIFPDFVAVFNSMLKQEDQVGPLKNSLNTDLRIFALMRLGINDCDAVAGILEYSARTIYVYKMRIKAKAIVNGDLFDDAIMAIKAVPYDETLFMRKSA